MDFSQLPSPFYRVAAKAIVLDNSGRILVLENDEGGYELPGGGWEFGETFEECLSREFQEELQVEVATISPAIAFAYRGRDFKRGQHLLRLAAFVTLANNVVQPSDSIVAARFVHKEEFLTLDMEKYEGSVKDHIDQIWSPS